MRSDGSNPCRHIPKFPERGKTRLITDAELKRLYAYLSKAEAEALEQPFILLAIRLQFEFAARMSEILKLEWAWIDLDNRRVEWPDSKTGGMSKPMSAEAVRLLESAPRLEKSSYVCPSIFDPNRPMSKHTYYKGWRRILGRAGLSPIGTHGIRHRSATDIANSGIPVKGRHGAHGAQDRHDVHALCPHRRRSGEGSGRRSGVSASGPDRRCRGGRCYEVSSRADRARDGVGIDGRRRQAARL